MQRDEVRARARGGRALRHDPRRRPRALLGGAAVQAAAETYSGLVEVGVGLIPGGAGTLNMLWRAFEASPRACKVDNYAVRHPGVQEHRPRQGRDERRGGQAARVLPQERRRLLRQRAAAHRGEGARDRPRGRGLPPAGAAGLSAAGRERHRDAPHDGRHAGGRRQASEHDAKIAGKLAEVLCGGVGGASREVTEDEMLELEREAFVSACAASRRARSACSTCS
jgi:3-hydroxyacyl-CoA dehydrogenase